MHQGRPMGPQQSPQGPPRFPNQNQWNGPPRQNGPGIRPGMPNGPPCPPQHRPMVVMNKYLHFRFSLLCEIVTSQFRLVYSRYKHLNNVP